MTYFDQIDPINDIFDQNYVHKPDRNNFYKLLVKKILGPKWRHRPKFREIGEIFLSIKVFKNHFSQVCGHKFGQKCHK